MDCGPPGSSVMGFPRQEYWSGSPPSPGDLPHPGVQLASPALSYFHALAKEMATHSSVLAWRIPLTEEPVGLSPWGCKELDPTEHACMHTFLLSLSLSLQSGMWS